MTVTDQTVYRPSTPSDLERVVAFPLDAGVGSIGPDRYLEELAQRMYRPEWTWLAERDGRMVGRAAWWGRSDSDHPLALDCLQVVDGLADRVAVATGLLAAGMEHFAAEGAETPPLYNLTLTASWRDEPSVAAAVSWRREAAASAGLTDEVERLRLEWAPYDGVPVSRGSVVFSPGTDADFLDAFRRVAQGSLDEETRRNLAQDGAEATAQAELAFYLGCPGDRSWWRLAHTTDGELAGLAIPSATPYHPNVGYLGVVPELRGRGVVDDLLAEITRSHADRGADLVTATTDVTNVPMAAAFARAGYRTTQVRLNLSAPAA